MRISRCLGAALPTVLACLLLMPAVRAQADDGSSLDVAILDILKARGIIDDAQYAELMELARSRVDRERSEIDLIQGRLERLRAPDLQTEGGTPGKLRWKSSDGKWSFNLKGRVIGRVEDFNSDDDAGQDDTNFSADFRLNFEGNAGAENVTYKVELDAPTNKNRVDPATEPAFNLRDAYINWAFESGANAELGQFKFPFGREMLTSSAQTDLMERSIASVQFSPEYEPGAMLWGTAQNGVWEFYAAMANGEGRSKNNTPGSDLNGLRDGVRVVWNPLGAFKLDGPAFQTMDEETTRIGIGAAYMVNHDSSGLATATAGQDTETLGLEFQAFTGPVSFLAENYSRTGDVSGGPNIDDDGYTLQAGWLFVPNVWEVVARLSAIDFDVADDQQETVLGLNYYVDRHNGKWMVDFSKLNNQGTTPDANRIRLQYQLIF